MAETIINDDAKTAKWRFESQWTKSEGKLGIAKNLWQQRDKLVGGDVNDAV